MAALPDFPQQRGVIWFGKPGARERVMLAASGWQIRAVLPQQPADIGLRGNDILIGLIDFRSTTRCELERIEVLIGEHRHLPLFAITSSDFPHSEPRTARLLAACQQHFPHPADLKELLHQLQAFGPDASASDTTHASQALDTLLGESTAMLGMRATLRKFAPVDLPVLITGETGT